MLCLTYHISWLNLQPNFGLNTTRNIYNKQQHTHGGTWHRCRSSGQPDVRGGASFSHILPANTGMPSASQLENLLKCCSDDQSFKVGLPTQVGLPTARCQPELRLVSPAGSRAGSEPQSISGLLSFDSGLRCIDTQTPASHHTASSRLEGPPLLDAASQPGPSPAANANCNFLNKQCSSVKGMSAAVSRKSEQTSKLSIAVLPTGHTRHWHSCSGLLHCWVLTVSSMVLFCSARSSAS